MSFDQQTQEVLRPSRRLREALVTVNGAFGHALVGDLRSALAEAGYAVTLTDRAAPAAPAGADCGTPVAILVADHDDPGCASFQDRWRAAGASSLVVVQEHPDVRIGPLDVPGTARCARCFHTRARQNGISGGFPEESGAGHALAVSVDGYPPYLLALVAALARDRLATIEGPTDQGNPVVIVNAVTLATRVLSVVPVNLCPRCDAEQPIGRPTDGRGMFSDLERVLQ